MSPGSPPDASRAWVAVVIAAVASFAARLVLARAVVSPFIFQDEGGYVGVARLLAGDAPTLYGPTYLPGWGLLLAPAAAVLDPAAFQNVAQGLNALVAAATIPALHLLGRRVAHLPPWVSAGAAVCGGLTAASLVQATMLLPESLLVLAVVLAVLAVHRALESGTRGWAVVAGMTVGAGYAVHPRAVVLVVAALVVAVLAWRTGRIGGGAAFALGGATVLTTGAAQVLHAWATAELYPAGTKPSLAGSPLGALGEPVGAAVITAGQSWYVLVASLGLVPLGVLAAANAGWTDRWSPRGLTGILVALGALGSLALGTIGSYDVGTGTDVTRADLPVYGRYLEQWVPVLIVLAPSLVRRWSTHAALFVAGAAAGLGLAIHAIYPSDTWTQPVAWHNIASLRAPVEAFGRDHVVQTGFAAAALVVVLVGGASLQRDRRAWLVPLAGVGILNVWAGVSLVHDWAGPASEAWAGRHGLGPVVAATEQPVWVDLDEDFHVFWAYNVQFWHPDVGVEYFDGRPPAEATLVLGNESEAPVAGATLLATERDGDLGLWSVGR